MKNIDLFNYSIAKSNNNFDFDFTSELIVLPKNKDELNELTIKNNELIELIAAYKIINNVTDNKKLKEEIIFKIIDILDNTKGSVGRYGDGPVRKSRVFILTGRHYEYI
ncbi:hypothetical protein [Mycoplasmopsis gallinarum]|uniref:hypothetical protein n=1 Tax=Mycoplasmopsis gallinarum TaxID=29557 RepID=UPI000487677E|nr:hypothetical protein [Mycoplasmopsis gallinarum]